MSDNITDPTDTCNNPYTYDHHHGFHPGIATDYDVTTAILVHHIHFWVMRNKRAKVNQHDGHTWMYQSIEAMAEAFPYWTKRQVERAIEKAAATGVILKGNYNKVKYDRTCWYAFANEIKFGISPNGEMDSAKPVNGLNQMVSPIPDTKTDTEKELLPPSPPKGEQKVNTALSKKVVVVPPLCLSLGADQDSYERLRKEFTKEHILQACEVAKSQGMVPDNFFGWIRDCIDKGYKPKISAADEAPANRRWAKDVLDGKTLGPIRIEALNSGIEFIYTSVREPDVFSYELAGFKDIVGKHYRSLQARLKGH